MTAPTAPSLPTVRIVREGGTAADTRVYVDGQLVPCCRRFTLEQKAGPGELPVLVLELFVGVVEIELPEAVLAALEATRQDAADALTPEGAGAMHQSTRERGTEDLLMRLAAGASDTACQACTHPAHDGRICPVCRDEAVAGTRFTQDVCGGEDAP